MTEQTIPFDSVKVALVSAKMRRSSKGRIAQFAAVPRRPVIPVDCSKPFRSHRTRVEECINVGLSRCTFTPLDRGHISDLFERVKCWHGRPEVFKTWGVGIRALKAEPRFVLNGGAA